MIDKIGQVFFWSSFIVPLIALITPFILVKKKEVSVRLIISFALAISTTILIVQSWTAIFYRDGLAAGFISSSGTKAISRILTQININWVVAGVICAVVGILLIFLPIGNHSKTEI